VWHAEKWRKGLDLDALSPMYDAGDRHFYVNELSRLNDGRLVVPVRWVMYHGELCFDAFCVDLDEDVGANMIITPIWLTDSTGVHSCQRLGDCSASCNRPARKLF
jgi:hypothetical protein